MNFHKRVISVLLVIALAGVALLVSQEPLKLNKDGDEVTAWYDRSDIIYFWYSDDSMTEYVTKAAVDFGEANDVHVFPMLITVDNYIEAVNEASIANEQMPDVYILKHTDLEMAYLAGLASTVEDEAAVLTADNFSEPAINSVTYKNQLVAYPLSYNTSVLVYNEDLLKIWAEQKALAILTGDGDKYADNDYFSEIDREIGDMLAAEYGDAFYEQEVISPDEYVVPEKDDSIYEVDSELVPYNELSDDEKVTVLASKTDDVFETAIPVTLNDLLTIADTFDAPSGVDGVMKWDVSDIFYNYWFAGDAMTFGGPAGDDKNDIVLKTTESVTYLKYYHHLRQFFALETAEADYANCIQEFMDGKMVFTIASVDVINTLEEAGKKGELEFAYGYSILPAIDQVTLARPMSTTNVVVINGYTDNKELANAFAAYLVGGYSSELYARTGKPSCNINSNGLYAGLDVFDASYANSEPLPKIIELENVWMELEAMYSRIWNDEDVDTELQGLEDTVKLFFN